MLSATSSLLTELNGSTYSVLLKAALQEACEPRQHPPNQWTASFTIKGNINTSRSERLSQHVFHTYSVSSVGQCINQQLSIIWACQQLLTAAVAVSPDVQKLHCISLDVLRKPAKAFTIAHPANHTAHEDLNWPHAGVLQLNLALPACVVLKPQC